MLTFTSGQTIGAPVHRGGPWRVLGTVLRVEGEQVVLRSAAYPTACLCTTVTALADYTEEPPAAPPVQGRRPASRRAGQWGDWLDW